MSHEDDGLTPIDAAIAFCGLFEAEVFVRLMFLHWGHPRSSDDELIRHLLEGAADALERSHAGEILIEGMPPKAMNFIAAVWYSEYCQLEQPLTPEIEERRKWIENVRRSLPSCFCDPADLV